MSSRIVNVMRERREIPQPGSGRSRACRTRGRDRARRPAQPVLITVEDVEHDDHVETYLEIRGRWSGQDRLIATIEVRQPVQQDPWPRRLRQVPQPSNVKSWRARPTSSRLICCARDACHGGPARHRHGEGRPVRLSRLGSPLRPAQGLFGLSDPAGTAVAGDHGAALAGGPGGAARLAGGIQPRLRRGPLPEGHLVRQRPDRAARCGPSKPRGPRRR